MLMDRLLKGKAERLEPSSGLFGLLQAAQAPPGRSQVEPILMSFCEAARQFV